MVNTKELCEKLHKKEKIQKIRDTLWKKVAENVENPTEKLHKEYNANFKKGFMKGCTKKMDKLFNSKSKTKKTKSKKNKSRKTKK